MDPDFTHTPDDVEFASSGRANYATIEAQRSRFLALPTVGALLEAMPQALFLFNPQRQLIHCNQAALRQVGETRIEQMLGLRMGEILGCDHTVGILGGCGSAEVCEHCGSMQAVRAALDGQIVEREADLLIESGENSLTRRYHLRAAPLPFEGQTLALIILSHLS